MHFLSLIGPFSFYKAFVLFPLLFKLWFTLCFRFSSFMPFLFFFLLLLFFLHLRLYCKNRYVPLAQFSYSFLFFFPLNYLILSFRFCALVAVNQPWKWSLVRCNRNRQVLLRESHKMNRSVNIKEFKFRDWLWTQ